MTFRIHACLLALSCVLPGLFSAPAIAQTTVKVSGYELYIGSNCVINGQAGTCKATFAGWTGESKKGHWVPFPGSERGAWTIQINYTGQPMFDGSVTIVSGNWNFIFTSGLLLRGTVTGGTVTWPPDKDTSIGCGNGVAVGEADLTVNGGGTATVSGCLHDLPKGAIIPPKIWGAFNFQ
jgi:hypothetical protein